MWDNHALLFKLANTLIVCALISVLGAGVKAILDSDWFPVRTMAVQGQLKHVTQEQLHYIAQHELKGTFFTLDMDTIRQSFERLPWVKQVNLYRRWPDQLAIHVKEYDAVARWGSHGLVDATGVWFDAATNELLPVFIGSTGSEKMMAAALPILIKWIDPLGLEVDRIELTERGAWKVLLSNQLVLALGRCDLVQAQVRVERFARHWPAIKYKNPSVYYVDLRYTDGFAINAP